MDNSVNTNVHSVDNNASNVYNRYNRAKDKENPIFRAWSWITGKEEDFQTILTWHSSEILTLFTEVFL